MNAKIVRIFMYTLFCDRVYLLVVYSSGAIRNIAFSDGKIPKTVQQFLITHKSFEHYNSIFDRVELVYE